MSGLQYFLLFSWAIFVQSFIIKLKSKKILEKPPH